MTDSDVQRVAAFLAAHALLLLGLALVAALAAAGVVIGAVHVLRRYRTVLRSGFVLALEHARRFEVVRRTVARSRTFIPSGYLALHLVLGLVLTAAISIFIVIAENVIGGGELVAFDLAFARALREQVTPPWERFFAVVSWLGEREAIAVATVAVGVRLLLANGVLVAVGWIGAQAAGGVLNLALKESFERTRPAFADPLLAASSWSFPSGHAMGTFILCGLGCYLLLRDVRSWTAAAMATAVALSWCALMAFSRLYLGVHFASDVIAGIVGGVAWVAVCAAGFEVARRSSPARDGRTRARAPST